MKNSRTLSIHALSLLLLLFLLLAGTMTKAQQTRSDFLVGLLRGIQVDSPQVFLWWGSGNHDSLKTDPLFKLELQTHQPGVWDKSQSQVRWDSVRVFDIPMDSIYLTYWWMPGRNQGLREVFMITNPAYAVRLKVLFMQYLGKPNKNRNKDGRFLYEWHDKGELSVWLSNYKFTGGRQKGVYLLITDPRISFLFM